MSISLFGIDGIRYLDEQSDKNIVYYYRIELNRIDKGQFHNLRLSEWRKLIKCGILLHRYPDIWYLTPKGKRLLNQVNIEYKP